MLKIYLHTFSEESILWDNLDQLWKVEWIPENKYLKEIRQLFSALMPQNLIRSESESYAP